VAAIETADELLQCRDALSRSVMELLAAAEEERAITRHLHDVFRFTQVSVTQERTGFDAEKRHRAFPRVDAEKRTTVE
jgi:hypothetical protein